MGMYADTICAATQMPESWAGTPRQLLFPIRWPHREGPGRPGLSPAEPETLRSPPVLYH